MKKDKKFLEELSSFLGDSKHKDEIVNKYDSFIKSEKASGKKIKDIIKGLGDPEELATKELEPFKNEKVSIFEKISKYFKNKKKEKEEKKEEKPKKETKKQVEKKEEKKETTSKKTKSNTSNKKKKK